MNAMTICIDGPGGAGKSTFAKNLADRQGLQNEQIVHGDWYFEPLPDPIPAGPTGYFNSQRFMDEVGHPLQNGEQPIVNEYVWQQRAYAPRQPPSDKELIIVEGIKILGLPVTWGVAVWLDTPLELREERFMNRKTSERRAQITDTQVLLDAFRYWAKDALDYEREIRQQYGERLVVISGQANIAEQISALPVFTA